MRTISATVFLASVASVAFVACGGAQKPKAPDPILVQVDRLIPKSESLDTVKATIRLAVENPRDDRIKILKIDYALDTGAVAGLLRGSIASGGILEGRQRAELEFDVRVPLPEDSELFAKLIEAGSIPAEMSGAVHFSDGTSTAFRRSGELVTPSLPSFVVHDAQAALYDEGRLEVALYLRLINDNGFSVTVQGVDYKVFLEDVEAKTEQALGLTLVGGSAQEFEVSTTLRAGQFAPLSAVLKRGSIHYRVVGVVNLAQLDLPFDHQGDISIPRPTE